MTCFKAVSLLLKGLIATIVRFSALLSILSMFTKMPQKGLFQISLENKTRHEISKGNVTGSMINFSKNTPTGSTNSRKPIILYTGNASLWQMLSDEDLSIYFTPAEISGIESQSCGDVKNASNPWQWQGSIQGIDTLGLRSGPCCPNGNAYGWWFF
jgi:hypothetical protein